MRESSLSPPPSVLAARRLEFSHGVVGHLKREAPPRRLRRRWFPQLGPAPGRLEVCEEDGPLLLGGAASAVEVVVVVVVVVVAVAAAARA